MFNSDSKLSTRHFFFSCHCAVGSASRLYQCLLWRTNTSGWVNQHRTSCLYCVHNVMSVSVQVSITRGYSGCLAPRWKSMILRTPLKEVSLPGLSHAEPSFVYFKSNLYYLMGHYLLHHCVPGEDPLAGDQNDHDMDSIAGVLKLYFRGLDNALFPKEVFHDLMSCVCECPLYFLHPQYTCVPQTRLTRLDNGGAFVLNELMSCSCCFFQPWRTSRTELSTSTKSCCQYPATPCLSWDTCSLSSTSEFHRSKLFLHVSPKVILFFWLSLISTQDKGYDNH